MPDPLSWPSDARFMPPNWALWLVAAAAAVVVSVIGTIGWLDDKYATKSELRLLENRLALRAEVLSEIKSDTKAMRSEIVELKVLLAGIK